MFQHGGHLLKDQGSMAAVLAGAEDLITYILDIVYSDYADTAGPLASPLVGRVGQATLVQNDGQFSISGGKLVIPAQATPSYGDLSLYGPTQSRAAGLTFLAEIIPSVLGNSMFGWDDGAASGALTNETLFPTASAVVAYNFAPLPTVQGALSLASHTLTVMLRNSGAFFFIDNNLVWVDDTKTDVSVGPGINGYLLQATSELWRIADLPGNATFPVPALGIRDFDLCLPGTGTGTSKIAAPAASNTFVHTPDALIKWTQTTVPASGTQDIEFRRTDASNRWRITLSSAGLLSLLENATSRGTIAGVINGDIISVTANNETIKVWVNESLGINYVSATANKTSTAGVVQSLGTGGVIANLEARTLDGVANVASSNHPGYGLATNVLPGPRATNDVFTHEADCIIEFQLDSLPTASVISNWFRRQDNSNLWFLTISSAGTIQLVEYVGGGSTTRGTAVGAVSGGERIRVIANGPSIKIFHDTTLDITYSSAVNFQTETNGKIALLPAGSMVSNYITWPIDLENAPNTQEATNVVSAFDLMATP